MTNITDLAEYFNIGCVIIGGKVRPTVPERMRHVEEKEPDFQILRI